jgi:hypothetical protein
VPSSRLARKPLSGPYVRRVCGVLLTLLAAVAATNAALDPFGMHRWLEGEGVNTYKPATHTRVRLFKAYEVERVRPQTLVMGSPRSHVGFSCKHPAFERLPAPCYNLAFDGATTREMFDYLVHANELRPLKVVLLGLDTYHLTDAPSGTRPGFDAAVLLSPRHTALRRAIEGDLRLWISADTLQASLDMLREQDEHEPEWFSADGQRLGDVFFRREGEEFIRLGPRGYFDSIDRQEVGFQMPPRADRIRDAAPVPDPAESSLAYVERIVDFCREHDIDLRIAITPSHVHQQEISALLGAEAAVESGKRALVGLLARHKARPGSAREPVPVWDFSGYSSITTEALPPPEGHEEMQFYWDSSHFKSTVGDLVLDRVFLSESAGQAVPVDFGVRLTADDVDDVLSMQRKQKTRYRETAAHDLQALRRLVESRARDLPSL